MKKTFPIALCGTAVKKFTLIASAMNLTCTALAGTYGQIACDGIFAPRVVAVPPTFAVRELCRTADGELRHYGWALEGGSRRRVYIASRDGVEWTTHFAVDGEVGAMVQSPWSGEWISFTSQIVPVRIARSKTGPGDPQPEITVLPWQKLECRQLLAMKSRQRWVACFSNVECRDAECYHSTVCLSDDDGRTWRRIDITPVPNVPRLHPGDKRPHWFNNGCEPTVAELADGTLVLAVRTSGEHHCFYRSTDGGETWSTPEEQPAFWAANTMPLFFRLSDGRLIFFWNNTAMLPTRDLSEYPEISNVERTGLGETVFTNRDALHAAISEDDGKTWRGFREVILNPIRNAADFRELGNDSVQEHDKSVHQTQALELHGGKVLLALGQNVAARRIVVFDPKWLYETKRTEDFRTGLGNVSTHLYVKSLSGGWRGWAGHCAWNRVPGALLVRDPDTDRGTKREVLQLCRIRDPRLVCDRQGVVWNYPAARKGRVAVSCRIDGEGFLLTLADHWMNPSDEVGPRRSPLSVEVTPKDVSAGSWHEVVAAWDADAGTATVSCDGREFARRTFSVAAPAGVSYLHLQSLAEGEDAKGAYFRQFSKE